MLKCILIRIEYAGSEAKLFNHQHVVYIIIPHSRKGTVFQVIPLSQSTDQKIFIRFSIICISLFCGVYYPQFIMNESH